MGQEALEQLPYGYFPLNESKVAALMETGEALVLLAYKGQEPVGILAAMVSDLAIFDARVAQEITWYSSDPRALINLFDTYVYWAEEIVKADAILCGSITPSSKRFLNQRGFNPGEKMMMRIL